MLIIFYYSLSQLYLIKNSATNSLYYSYYRLRMSSIKFCATKSDAIICKAIITLKQKQIEWVKQLNEVEKEMNKLSSNRTCPYTIPQIMQDIDQLHNELMADQQKELAKQICEKIQNQPSFWNQAKGIFYICFIYFCGAFYLFC